MTDIELRREIIATRVRLAREMAGLSQGQVARLLGMHRPSISEVEAGRRKVTADELVELARIYAVNVSWLAGEGVELPDPDRDRIDLAARELTKLRPEDRERLFQLFSALRDRE